jgi:hypothetical protein
MGRGGCPHGRSEELCVRCLRWLLLGRHERRSTEERTPSRPATRIAVIVVFFLAEGTRVSFGRTVSIPSTRRINFWARTSLLGWACRVVLTRTKTCRTTYLPTYLPIAILFVDRDMYGAIFNCYMLTMLDQMI